MMEFDPDSDYVKVRGIGTVHFEQNGAKFSAGHRFLGMVDGGKSPDQKTTEEKQAVRKRARAKIAKKTGKKKDTLKDFREQETPDAVSSAKKEDAAAAAAEENA